MSNIVPSNPQPENDPQTHYYNEIPLKTFKDKNGEDWIFATEVCRAVEVTNVSDAVGRLDEDEKSTIVLTDSGKPTKYLLVNEAGLYSLILSSRKPSAKPFKRWVTHVLLPALRKTGRFEMKPRSMSEVIGQFMVMVEQEIVDLKGHVAEHDEKFGDVAIQLEDLAEKVDRADWVTIKSWCDTHKIHVEWLVQSRWGREAVKVSRDRGVEVFEIETPNERYSHVNVYHKSVLKDVCVAKPKPSNQMPLLPNGKTE